MRGAQRVVRIEPGAEQRRDLARQAQHRPAGVTRAGGRGALRGSRSRSLSVSCGITGATITPTGMPAAASRATSSSRRCGAGARGSSLRASSRSSVPIETKTRTRLRAASGASRSRSRSISAALGRDRQRMRALGEHLDHLPGDPPLALDRLVGIGVGAQRDRLAAVARMGQLAAQQFGGIGLGEQPGLEIEAGRQVEVRVRGPRVAVDAAVLAALVGVDRLRERDVGRGRCG